MQHYVQQNQGAIWLVNFNTPLILALCGWTNVPELQHYEAHFLLALSKASKTKSKHLNRRVIFVSTLNLRQDLQKIVDKFSAAQTTAKKKIDF